MHASSVTRFTFRSLLGVAVLVLSWACGDDSTGPTLEITTVLLPNAAQATAYDQSLEATGGTGDLTWSLRSGYFLPTGLTLSADGRITGTPTDSLSTWLFAVDVASTDGGTDFEFLRITTVPLTLRATGIIDQVEAPLALAVGDTFTVTYSVDMGAPDSDALAERGRYLAAHSVRVQIGSYACTVDLSLVSADHTVSILDDTGTVPYDEYGLILFEQLVSTGQEGSLLGCPQLSGWNANNQTELAILSDASATAFENDALPRGPLDLSVFSYARLTFEFYNPSNCSLGQCTVRSVGAPLQSLTVVLVD